ncbi:formyltransferase family protein [Micromonospora sp. KLBMP9576]|uniref:formyltransferase family protein n=1 Tax=Micromonospora sp. KLBMP9576 TaxID=3424769 RepID=UPI003D8CDED7
MRGADGVRTLGPRHGDGPLRIAVLVSATGANLHTLLGMSARRPHSYQVSLVASHAERVAALDVARNAGVETWPGDFDAYCGLASQARDAVARQRYRLRARGWHDRLGERIGDWERRNGPLDLVVLAYHRWVEGDLLDRFDGRMINQHPGDLSVLDEAGHRLLIGRDPVRLAMSLGHDATRTSCFLVDATHDGGAVLCLGPPVPVDGRTAGEQDARRQELIQKSVSDPVALSWTVQAFAERRLGLDSTAAHPDGSPVVLVDGKPAPLGGRRFD